MAVHDYLKWFGREYRLRDWLAMGCGGVCRYRLYGDTCDNASHPLLGRLCSRHWKELSHRLYLDREWHEDGLARFQSRWLEGYGVDADDVTEVDAVLRSLGFRYFKLMDAIARSHSPFDQCLQYLIRLNDRPGLLKAGVTSCPRQRREAHQKEFGSITLVAAFRVLRYEEGLCHRSCGHIYGRRELFPDTREIRRFYVEKQFEDHTPWGEWTWE